ncbi:hypothetical protein, conserved in T. vivax [Trypanosoma vivax Y486]|uniref:Uncharacterized protein n=1 Tax=Trypanosoma vivax (strain Y486) TaxID=1055687 RepID=F9WSR1_TRYVY|nr:hypothetical protein, conserved in T. vivax [Trypanosoma vivax Y486]|eukprot:CCD20600.1 hypothetical protein, conserved in T. vivax [Trypanosoma vivax Y486]
MFDRRFGATCATCCVVRPLPSNVTPAAFGTSTATHPKLFFMLPALCAVSRRGAFLLAFPGIVPCTARSPRGRDGVAASSLLVQHDVNDCPFRSYPFVAGPPSPPAAQLRWHVAPCWPRLCATCPCMPLSVVSLQPRRGTRVLLPFFACTFAPEARTSFVPHAVRKSAHHAFRDVLILQPCVPSGLVARPTDACGRLSTLWHGPILPRGPLRRALLRLFSSRVLARHAPLPDLWAHIWHRTGAATGKALLFAACAPHAATDELELLRGLGDARGALGKRPVGLAVSVAQRGHVRSGSPAQARTARGACDARAGPSTLAPRRICASSASSAAGRTQRAAKLAVHAGACGNLRCASEGAQG